MLSWLAKQLITRIMARTRAGDIRPTVMLDTPDMQFVFPGSNSWSGHYLGRDQHRRWLERLARVGVKTEPDEVLAGGWPWNMTICVRGRCWWDNSGGERIYNNRFVIWSKLRWGRVTHYEVYEDTEKATALDAYLEAHDPALLAA